MSERFHRLSGRVAAVMGSPWAFVVALAIILVWGITGPIFRFSDTWQLIINTGTTIVTFLMVFLIQNTQNRDTRAIHLKLDELLRAQEGARNSLVDLENCTDEELERLQEAFHRLRQREPAIAECVSEITAELEDEVDDRDRATAESGKSNGLEVAGIPQHGQH